jgi:hypothetical protein
MIKNNKEGFAHHLKLRFLRKVRDAQLTVRSSQRLRQNQVETDYDVHHPTHTPTVLFS